MNENMIISLIFSQYLLFVIFGEADSKPEQPQLRSQIATNTQVDDPHLQHLTESFTSCCNETKEYLASNNSIFLNRPKRTPPGAPIQVKAYKVLGHIVGILRKINLDQEVEHNFRKVFIALDRNLTALINGHEYIDSKIENLIDALVFLRRDIETPGEFSYQSEEAGRITDDIEQVLIQRYHDIIPGFGEKYSRNDHLLEFFQSANKNYTEVEISRLNAAKEFETALTYANNSKIDGLTGFVTYYTSEKARISQVSREQRIRRLKDEKGILSNLRRASSWERGSIRDILLEVIHQDYVVPLTTSDTRAYAALSSVFYSVVTLVSVMRYLIKMDIYLANESYGNEDLESYNSYIDQAINDLDDFKHLLGWEKDGLLDQTIMLFEKVMKSLNNTYSAEFLKDKLGWLRKEKLLLADSSLFRFIMKDTPGKFRARLRFDEKSLSTPIGQWKDGSEVSYAVQYVTSDYSLYSKVGEWSRPSLVYGKSNAILEVPPHSTYNRYIFRRFNNQNAELVGIIEPGNQSEFRDIDRDLWNAASGVYTARAIDEVQKLIGAGANTSAHFDMGRTVLHAAASNGNSELAERFLQNDSASIHAQDVNGYTPLHVAAEGGWTKFVIMALKHGGKVNAQTKAGSTSLHLAVANHYAKVVDALLIDKDVDINAKDFIGAAPIHQVVLHCKETLLDTLLKDNRTNVNLKTIGKITPLHLSTLINGTEITMKLLQAQAINVNAQSDGNMTALHFATMFGNLPSLQLLIKNNSTDVNAQSINGWTPLHYAVATGRNDFVRVLLKTNNLNVNAIGAGRTTALHLAAVNNQSVMVEELLDHGAEIDLPNFEGLTVLHLAAINGDTSTLNTLLSKGAHANAKTNNGSAVLHLLVSRGDVDGMKTILENGKDVQVDSPNNDGLTALHLAIVNNHTNIVQLLENNGANINIRTFNGSTLLHVKAAEGDLRGVQALLSNSHNVQVDVMNSEGMTALHLATLNNHVDVMEFLVTKGGANASATTRNGSTILHLAAADGNLQAIKSILANCPDLQFDSKNDKGSTALHIAAEKGELQIVKSLLDTGKASLTMKNDKSETALLLAERGGHSEVGKLLKSIMEGATARLLEVSKSGDAHEIPLLIKKGADIERREDGWTPLGWGAYHGHFEVVKCLRAAGAEVMPKNTFMGENPLIWAVRAESLDIVKFLIEEGAEVNAKGDYGQTALMDAARHWRRLDIVKFLVEKGAEVNAKAGDGETALMRAAYWGALDIVTFLVEKGAEVNAKAGNGWTPLIWAVVEGRFDTVKFLVEKGAEVNAKAGDGETALMLAVYGGFLDIIAYLKSKGATT